MNVCVALLLDSSTPTGVQIQRPWAGMVARRERAKTAVLWRHGVDDVVDALATATTGRVPQLGRSSDTLGMKT